MIETFVYILNAVMYAVLPMVVPIYITRLFKLPLLNPVTLFSASMYPITLMIGVIGPAFTIEKGLLDPYYQYALLVQNVHDLIQIIISILVLSYLSRNKVLQNKLDRVINTLGPARPDRMCAAAIAFFVLFVLSYLMLTSASSYGLLNWLSNPRTGYQFHRTGAGHWYALSVTFLTTSFTLALLYTRYGVMMIVGPLILACSYFLGSKGYIIFFAIFFVITLFIRKHPYRNIISIISAVGGIVLTSAIFIRGSGQESVILESVLGYFDHFVNGAKYFKAYMTNEISLFYGEIFTSSFWELVPRSIYPEKPFVYGILLVDEHFYPGAAAATHTPAFGGVPYFADFGWPGVFVSSIFNVSNLCQSLMYSIVFSRLQDLNVWPVGSHNRVLFYLFLLLMAPGFLVFFPFPLNAVLFGCIILLIEVFNRVTFKTQPLMHVHKSAKSF